MAGGTLQNITCSNNSAKLTFNNDLSAEKTGSEESLGTPETHAYDGNQAGCEGAGYQYCADNTCITKEETCPQKTCEEVLDCGVWGTWNTETCQCDCDEGWFGKVCDIGCIWDNESGCHTCDELQEFRVTDENECARCNGTSAPRQIVTVGKIKYCGLVNCGTEYFHDTKGGCIACSEVPGVDTKAIKGTCSECRKSNNPLFTTQKGCVSCSAGYLSASSTATEECEGTKLLRWMGEGPYGEASFPCSDPASRVTTSAECARCNGSSTPRKLFEYDGANYCGLETCPADMPLRIIDGSCFPCNFFTGVLILKSSDCHTVCDKTNYRRFLDVNGFCAPCEKFSMSYEFAASSEECERCGNLRTYDAETGVCK